MEAEVVAFAFKKPMVQLEKQNTPTPSPPGCQQEEGVAGEKGQFFQAEEDSYGSCYAPSVYQEKDICTILNFY